MQAPKFDLTSDKGKNAFNGQMGSKSYVEGWMYSSADSEAFAQMGSCPDSKKMPHAYRWFIHIAALQGVRGLAAPAPAAAAAPKAAKAAAKAPKAKAAKKAVVEEEDDEDFDVFGDDDDDDEEEEAPKESRADMIARLKHEAEVRLKKKEENQRTLVGLDVKPWSTDQDLAELFKKLTTTINLPDAPIKWGEICHQVEVAYGIKKLVMSFVMGSQSSSDEVVEMIEALEDEVQSVEVTSMNVL